MGRSSCHGNGTAECLALRRQTLQSKRVGGELPQRKAGAGKTIGEKLWQHGEQKRRTRLCSCPQGGERPDVCLPVCV